MWLQTISTPTNTGEEKTNNERSIKLTTAENDDEFIPKHSKKPKTFSGEIGMDCINVEAYEQLLQDSYQPSIEGSEDEIISVLDIYVVIPTIAIDTTWGWKSKIIGELNRKRKYSNEIWGQNQVL